MKRSGFSGFGLVLLGLLALGWGFNWPIMKFVLREVPPLTFRSICLLAGGVGMLLIARVAGQSIAVPRRYWSRLLMLTGCNTFGWNVLVIYGIALLPSGRAALLGYTMPLWSMLLAVWLLHERLTANRILALFLGLAGVAVLMSDEIAQLSGALAGVALMLAAAFLWGLGVVLLKRFALPIPTLVLTGWTILIAGAPITLAALILEHGQWRPVSFYSALGVLYNILVAFMFCYWAWNRIVLMVPVAVSSLSSLITPVVGVLSGVWLLHEPLTWRELAAGAFILGAIALVLRPGPRAKASAPPIV